MDQCPLWEASYFVLITTYHYAYQVKADELGRACGTHWRGQESMKGFGGKARRKDITWKTKA
jgi:hypothetical protein